MYWADRHAEAIQERFKEKTEPLLVRDEKTLSGRVHIGSMRGVAVHGLVAEVLNQKGIPTTFLYELNDFDVMDGIPAELDPETWGQYLGLPLNKVPAPDGIAENFALYYAAEFQNVIHEAGFTPEYYKSSDLYLSGKMNDAIRLLLEKADIVRRIYKEVSGSEKKEDWLPISMVCMQCGKIGTTQGYAWDGTNVSYRCTKGPGGAVGCEHEGSASPFDGGAKLPWKVEWPAKWLAVGVDIEGAGKDHSTKGGSRDVANALAKEVFGIDSPYDIPYEFFLDKDGKKMSSSKGRGTSSREIADNFPPTILRLALIAKEPQVQTSIDPVGELLATLYDQHDRLAEKYWAGEVQDDETRLFELLYHGTPPQRLYLPRFSVVAFVAQMTHLEPAQEFATLKGGQLTDEEVRELTERIEYAKKWLEHYAPDKYRFVIQDEVPPQTKDFTDVQKKALTEVVILIEKGGVDGATLHAGLHGIKERVGIAPKELFSAIYLSFLGRDSGPQAGWFLSTLDPDFVITRLRAVVA